MKITLGRHIHEKVTPIINAILPYIILLIISASSAVLIGYYSIDLEAFLAGFLATVSWGLAKKRLFVSLLGRIYESRIYENTSALFFVALSLILFMVGYEYGLVLVFVKHLSMLIVSFATGLASGVLLFIVSTIYDLKRGVKI